jgi:hypothetical protein
MELALSHNGDLSSGFFPSFLSLQEENTETNSGIFCRQNKEDSNLLRTLKKFSEDPKTQPSLKTYWDTNNQPRVYATRDCQEEDSLSQNCDYFERHIFSLEFLRTLEDNWDSYDAEAPNKNAFDKAQKTIDYLQMVNFPPTKIVPSVEGGLSLLFVRGEKYAEIECDNDGDVICGLSDRKNDPILWEIGVDINLIGTIEKIREFFRRH